LKNKNIINALTIDVEDYFQVSAFSPYIARSDWDRIECRVERNIEVILKMLMKHEIKATFFILGWIAERYPNMVRQIALQGHEIASHGYGHERVTNLSPEEFYKDIVYSKKILEEISGKEVIGYRAPSFSIVEDNFWVFDCLINAGYKYSSSIYPIKHDHYGIPNFSRFPCEVRQNFLEIPVSTLRVFNKNLPSSGGGYFRLFPYLLSKWMLNRFNVAEKKPGIFYFHPWELDFDQPRVFGIDMKTRFRHYINLKKMRSRLDLLFADFNWGRMDAIFLKNVQ
jgi:polysaccharide deacetylase family protein (PEP-CTERM system associated)